MKPQTIAGLAEPNPDNFDAQKAGTSCLAALAQYQSVTIKLLKNQVALLRKELTTAKKAAHSGTPHTGWHTGAPPHIGWWATGRSKGSSLDDWRWWDGKKWSYIIPQECTARTAAEWAQVCVANYKGRIIWSHYYPANARVPRIDPAHHHAH